MCEITNLSRYRKQQARAEKRSRGDQNATLFGRTKAEKMGDLSAKARADTHLDGHLRETPQGPGRRPDD